MKWDNEGAGSSRWGCHLVFKACCSRSQLWLHIFRSFKKKSCSRKGNVERCFSIATSIVFWMEFYFFLAVLWLSDSCFAFMECWINANHTILCLGFAAWCYLNCHVYHDKVGHLRDMKELCLNLNLPCCGFPCRTQDIFLPPCSVQCVMLGDGC